MADMSRRALSFGAVASAYERFRPGYPEALADLVEHYAGRPLLTALEIGAGTGKATRLFAHRGVQVTATEPDAAMLVELRRTAPADVETVHAAFEDLVVERTFDLVYAAAALHWTRAEGRWERVVALLGEGGVFASFGGPFELVDPALDAAVAAARAPYLSSDDVPSPDGTPPEQELQWPGTELTDSASFTDVQQHVIERRLALTREEYVGYLSTVSAYLELRHADRKQVYRRIAEVLPDTVELSANITAHLARRRAQGTD